MTADDMSRTGDEVTTLPAEDVVADVVKVMQDRFPSLAAVPSEELAEAMGEVLAVYGAMVQVRTFGNDYERRERSADSLTKRAYGAGLLQRLARDAEQAARVGVDPAANRALARMLRDRAHREGRNQ